MKPLQWTSVRRLGKNRLLASSYVWLVAVPVLAKLLKNVNELDLSGYVPGLVLPLELPFSWLLFYYSSLAISVGATIFYLRCPAVIRDFRDYSDYLARGSTVSGLSRYRVAGFSHESWTDQMRAAEERALEDGHDLATVQRTKEEIGRHWFWALHETADNDRACSCRLAATCYALGLLGFGVVFFQNLLFVMEATLAP